MTASAAKSETRSVFPLKQQQLSRLPLAGESSVAPFAKVASV